MEDAEKYMHCIALGLFIATFVVLVPSALAEDKEEVQTRCGFKHRHHQLQELEFAKDLEVEQRLQRALKAVMYTSTIMSKRRKGYIATLPSNRDRSSKGVLKVPAKETRILREFWLLVSVKEFRGTESYNIALKQEFIRVKRPFGNSGLLKKKFPGIQWL